VALAVAVIQENLTSKNGLLAFQAKPVTHF